MCDQITPAFVICQCTCQHEFICIRPCTPLLCPHENQENTLLHHVRPSSRRADRQTAPISHKGRSYFHGLGADRICSPPPSPEEMTVYVFPERRAGVRRKTRDPHYKRFHSCWRNMMGRCYEPRTNRYEYYGGRGIRVCEQWHNFKNFYLEMYESFARHARKHNGDSQLDRRNADDNYYPENCRWKTALENNRRRTRRKPRSNRQCEKGGCSRKYLALGLCRFHYDARRRIPTDPK